jgi:oligopeptide/dipeptide ABC transporter ATP-binding protein
MYAGRVVEQASVAEVFRRPLHPYTRGLLGSVPKVGREKAARLEAIPGVVPDLLGLPSGCRFRDRCSTAIPSCAESEPLLETQPTGPMRHSVACIRAGEAI